MGHVVKVDRRGRVTLPAKVKKQLRIGSLVRLDVRGDRLEVVPVPDPLQALKGSAKTRASAEALDELAERIVTREALK